MRRLLVPICLLLYLCSCKKLKEPVFNGVQNVQLNKPVGGKAILVLDMSYYNPNDKNGVIKEADGDAWLDSTFLGHFRLDSVVQVPAKSNFIIPLKLEVEMKNILKHSMAAFLKPEMQVSIKGTAKVGNGTFYKKVPLVYEGKQNMEELFKKIKL
jgi:LEA14-like dessication related protein